MSNVLQIFAKAPIAGTVKTRLARTLGAEQALRIHQRLCEMVVDMALQVSGVSAEVWTTDAAATDYFEAMGLPCYLQQGQSLGTRMDFALRHGLARHQRVVIIGADAPSIDQHYVEQAFQALAEVPVVFGPAADGGYVLIGASTPVPFLLKDMPWGTADVMALTLDRLFTSGSGFKILSERWDIDTQEDLQQHLPHWL